MVMVEVGLVKCKPVHELSVCVAPMYGNQSSWLQITDFVEHNKLQGANFFYFYVGQISKYDERMLNEYVRTGDLEVVKLQDKYQRIFISWQFLQIQDCHLRSKYISKWTAFIDLDERLSTPSGNRIVDVLRSIDDPAVGEVQMQSMSIVKDEDYPKRFVNVKEMKKELIFEKYNKTVDPTWQGSKAIIKPEKIGIMSVHAAVAKFPGIKTVTLNTSQAVIRHFRSTKYRISGSEWHVTPEANGSLPIFKNTPLSEAFLKRMRIEVVRRVLHVYDRIPVNCSTIPEKLREMIRHPDPCKKMWPTF
uniref:Glycosyltransferase family 92 protein n=1 Tax=Caenorhabditis tropicalis TaxID=1561998 RepID=A0A1I7V4M8_9PELO